MPKRLRPQLTFANVVSCLALFVALGGSAYAVKQLPKKSVGTPQLKRGAVTKQKVRRNAINGAKVKNHSLLAKDFKTGQLPAGPRGEQGPPGANATNLFAYVRDQDANSAAAIEYGKGTTGEVSDPPGDNQNINPYVVSFNRDLTGCVVSGTVGRGLPPGEGAGFSIGPIAADILGSSVKVFSFSASGAPQDTSFMLSVFC